MWLLDPSFCNHGELNKFDLQKNIFSSVNKGTCVLSCYYQYFLHKVLILQCPWKEKIGCQYKAESIIITIWKSISVFPNDLFLLQFSEYVVFLHSYREKKKGNAILDVIKVFFFFSSKYCQKSQNLGYLIFQQYPTPLQRRIVKGNFPSNRHYSIMKSHFPFNKNNP